MENKTHITAEDNKQEILILRQFDLPVNLLYKAYTEAELVEQWMGNKVLKLDNRTHGSYLFETKDAQGNVLFRANGSIHKAVENQTIIRTFEMENSSFPVQLEYLDFKAVSEDTSMLEIKIVFRSIEDRDNMLRLPFAYGINMAHNKLQQIIKTLK
ncbi:SRPBCC domain-containing protein [Algoriphagus sp. AGSA1]|uniref:SRPBCC family protein n=1 Tax=Algoriphagus sp. AGSA1 TaxID=2907213 RepID=UPI001F433EE0|nr:SRPBCC domain-containing protein [Algoriphagus sp. AGSA1]MCE7053491.1 SRPBCC domain-containing protein [Algoriphagus sp. AGSA1]